MDYTTTIDYINSFINFEKIPIYSYTSSFRLERMHAFLQELGDPHCGLKVIHVAGSKGKGSTCATIASILRQAGYRVGLYTSPHLMDTRERIRVLNCETKNFEDKIGEQEFIELVEGIRHVAERFRRHNSLGALSFFEILTACAFLYFKKKDVDFAVLETGLGGRLDATNVVEPLVCGITNISLEHIDKLGSSLEFIAREKAGIIKCKAQNAKRKGIVFSALQEREVRDVIRSVCRERKNDLYEIGRDINYSILYSDENKQVFNLEGQGYSYRNLEINLIGSHQVENAAVAVSMAEFIKRGELRMDTAFIEKGLKDIYWPGRLQVVQKKPYIILDGAQNVASMKASLAAAQKNFNYNRVICIFGISRDKDIKGVTKELDRFSDIVILTKSGNNRAESPVSLRENFSKASIELSDDVEEALTLAMKIRHEKDLILVTGSLYVVGEALRYFQKGQI